MNITPAKMWYWSIYITCSCMDSKFCLNLFKNLKKISIRDRGMAEYTEKHISNLERNTNENVRLD